MTESIDMQLSETESARQAAINNNNNNNIKVKPVMLSMPSSAAVECMDARANGGSPSSLDAVGAVGASAAGSPLFRPVSPSRTAKQVNGTLSALKPAAVKPLKPKNGMLDLPLLLTTTPTPFRKAPTSPTSPPQSAAKTVLNVPDRGAVGTIKASVTVTLSSQMPSPPPSPGAPSSPGTPTTPSSPTAIRRSSQPGTTTSIRIDWFRNKLNIYSKHPGVEQSLEQLEKCVVSEECVFGLAD
ncbi:leucine-rich repeat extensin-like protein 5 [Thrips palmi]|uniref:Leucine-rich repeat extensin-like protein 5 n=1 Tax=Thrips palmi TaxID=161013 RepID=A0A6P8ZLR9_THRPL|nr:leucine-rich repeat extensin-like protein 5 [Thrips palmi]